MHKEKKFKECKAYVESVLKKQYPDCGIVFTRHADSIKEAYMRTVYKTKYYIVKKDNSGPTPKYLIYRDGVEVKKFSSQVGATMWVSRQRGRQNEP